MNCSATARSGGGSEVVPAAMVAVVNDTTVTELGHELGFPAGSRQIDFPTLLNRSRKGAHHRPSCCATSKAVPSGQAVESLKVASTTTSSPAIKPCVFPSKT